MNYIPYCCDDTFEFTNECEAACEGYNVTASCVQEECPLDGSTTITMDEPTDISGAHMVSACVAMAVMVATAFFAVQ